MKRTISILIALYLAVSANALVYYQQDWTNNGDCALTFDGENNPFDPNCLTALGNKYHNIHLNSTVVSPNYILSCKHWHVTKGCRIKKIGNTNLYLGRDPNGIAQFSDIYVISDYRDLSVPDFTLYRIKRAINPSDPNIPDPNEDSDYDWTNDPNGYFEDANLTSYMPLYKRTNELGKDAVLAGFGPHRIFGVHDPHMRPPTGPYEYAVGSGTLHRGYNQISAVSGGQLGRIQIQYYASADNGEVPNEVGVGMLDSGSGFYIQDTLDGKYKIAGTFEHISNQGVEPATAKGPRVSSYIDDIAQAVEAMGTPTLADKILGGLQQDITVSSEIENDANELNPVDPNSDEVTVTITADDFSELVNNGANTLSIYVDVPPGFEMNWNDPNSDFTYDISNDIYYCDIDLNQIDPNNPVTKTLDLQVNHFAEPLDYGKISVTTIIDDLTETFDTIFCPVANWTDPDSQPGVIYVNGNAAVSASGTSWEYPYKTLEDALERASNRHSDIDAIWLVAGTYTNDYGYWIDDEIDIEIYGGFVGSESDPNQRSNVAGKTVITVLDSSQPAFFFFLGMGDTPRTYVLDGLTITGGQYGVYLYKHMLDIRHCVITGNETGIFGDNATLTMQDSVLTYNGVGMDISNSGIAFNRNIIAFNEEEGLKLDTTDLFIANSVVSENQLDGMYFVSPNSTEILNCDIVNNNGYGIYGLSGGATTKINNCIVYGNNDDTIPAGQYIGNNVQSDPPFWFPYVADSNYVQYQLSPDANSCIDTGSTSLVYDYPLDLYGRDRVENSTVDIGAVESLPVSDCDFNIDGVVNFIDYAEFAGVWCLDSSDPNYNIQYDFDTDGTIDVNDLCIFAENWLDGAMSTGTVTSTYRVDFGYRVPETEMMMMSMPTLESEPVEMFALDGTPLEIVEAQETEQVLSATEDSVTLYPYDKVADVPVEKRLEIAKDRLGITELATQETTIPCVTPKINLIQQEREQRLHQMENIPVLLEWLDKVWLSDELDEAITEEQFLEFRKAVESFL